VANGVNGAMKYKRKTSGKAKAIVKVNIAAKMKAKKL
jgi:hypothetical protein